MWKTKKSRQIADYMDDPKNLMPRVLLEKCSALLLSQKQLAKWSIFRLRSLTNFTNIGRNLLIYCKYYCTSVASCLIISLPILLEQSCGQSQDTWKDKKSGSSLPVFYPNAPFFTSRVIKPTALSSLFQKKHKRMNLFEWNLLTLFKVGLLGLLTKGG